eukprot:TRINITY_DN10340_c0_g1_i1.p1 TRINITY_DN10340_c0_g1~~TRINITY_DN10340_c0_g1_i1.p1  ORF type:complete len:678 (+),score=214.89 TRINITY_DN10340_c0_g1_i1:59-2092(+)
MNPINAARREQIQRITQRVMSTFAENYLKAFKYVSIRDAKAKREEKSEEDSSYAEPPKDPPKSTPEDPHRPRGNNKYKKDITPELKARISTWDTLDYDVDPYVAFIVEASIGEKSSSVYRRYNAFKKLNAKLGGAVPDAKKLFPVAKTFEGRKFDHGYLTNRKEKLQQFLDAIVKFFNESKGGEGAEDKAEKIEYLIEWLGLNQSDDPDDVKFREIFDIAYTNTKWRLWIWKRIPYDKEEEAIAKLVIEEIKREMWSEVVSSVPNVPKARQLAIQTAYKTISATVGPAVAAGWKAAKAAIDPVKVKVAEVVDAGIEKLLDVEDEIKKKLSDQIKEGLEPILEQVQPVLGKLAEKFVEPVMDVMGELAPARKEVLDKFQEVVDTGDVNKVDEIEKIVKGKRQEAEQKVNSMIEKSLEGVLGELSAAITIEALSELFSPLKKLINVIETTFGLLFDPTPHLYPLKKMCEYRIQIEDLDISQGTDKVEDLLDQEESWVMWRRWWTGWDYRYKAWSLYYHTWGISELAGVSLVVRKSAFDYAQMQRKWIKRWCYTFGDYLHEKAKTATPAEWKKIVKESFEIGYNKANEYFYRRSMQILKEFVLAFFYAAIGVKVEEFLMKALKVILDPLTKQIPSPISDILDVENIARESINKALSDSMTLVVTKTMIEPFVAAFEKAKF